MEAPDNGYDKIARFYDLDMGCYEDDIGFYVQLARGANGPVLDLGCGTGRLARAIAEAGLRIDGLDSSERMLSLAERRLREAGLFDNARLIKGDAGQFDLGRRYGLVIFAMNSFMHLATASRQLACLRSVRRHLRPGGLFVMDLPNPEIGVLGHTNNQLVLEFSKSGPLPGWTVTKLRSQEVDIIRQIVTVTFVYDEVSPGGSVRRTTAAFEMRYLYRNEMEAMLQQADLPIDAIYGDFEGGELDVNSAKMVFIASRC